jgi:hypothetical protein
LPQDLTDPLIDPAQKSREAAIILPLRALRPALRTLHLKRDENRTGLSINPPLANHRA